MIYNVCMLWPRAFRILIWCGWMLWHFESITVFYFLSSVLLLFTMLCYGSLDLLGLIVALTVRYNISVLPLNVCLFLFVSLTDTFLLENKKTGWSWCICVVRWVSTVVVFWFLKCCMYAEVHALLSKYIATTNLTDLGLCFWIHIHVFHFPLTCLHLKIKWAALVHFIDNWDQ